MPRENCTKVDLSSPVLLFTPISSQRFGANKKPEGKNIPPYLNILLYEIISGHWATGFWESATKSIKYAAILF